MKQKTALAQAIELLEQKRDMWTKYTNQHKDIRGTYTIAIMALQTLKPIERQQIEEAIDNTVAYITGKDNKLYSEIYFNKNLTQD